MHMVSLSGEGCLYGGHGSAVALIAGAMSESGESRGAQLYEGAYHKSISNTNFSKVLGVSLALLVLIRCNKDLKMILMMPVTGVCREAKVLIKGLYLY